MHLRRLLAAAWTAAAVCIAGFLVGAVPVAGAATRAQQDINAPVRIDSGRFTFVCWPADSAMARGLLLLALRTDTFPGLPRPVAPALVAIAPDGRRFREWIGPNAPEWGAAVAFPALARIILQSSRAGSSAGDPRVVLRHELAHLAIYEQLGGLAPHWFDEGYASFAAGEWKRTDAFAANILIVGRGTPSLDSLDKLFLEGSDVAQAGYALAHVAVENMASLDPERGLALFFQYWKDTRSMDLAVRQAYGLTLSAYEERFKRAASRRYGLISVITDLGIFSALLFLLLAPFFLRRRRLLRERLATLRKAESVAERRAVTDALTDLLEGGEKGKPG